MTTKLKSQLEAAREALAAALSASHAGDKQLAKLERARAGVAAEIEQLEVATEANPDNEDGIARLQTLREKQRLLDRKIATLQTDHQRGEADARRVELADALSDAVTLIIEVGKPTLARITEQAAAAFAPFYHPGTRLDLAVQRNDVALSFRAFLVTCGYGVEQGKPTRALRLLEALIAGEPLPWIWPGLAPTPAPAPATPAQAPQPTPAAVGRPSRKLQSAMP